MARGASASAFYVTIHHVRQLLTQRLTNLIA